MEPEFLEDSDPCTSDPDRFKEVIDTYYAFADIFNAMLADDKKEIKIKLAIFPHKLGIRRNAQNAQDAWF